MYFTRFPVNKTRRDTRRLLGSPYMMHAAIAGSFPPGGKRTEQGRVLWRVDEWETGAVYLYIVSPNEPSLVGLDEQIGWPDKQKQWESRCYDSFLKQIDEGQLYTFRLLANPVLNRKGIVNEHGNTKRIGHLTIVQQAGWLIGEAAYRGTGNTVPELFAKQEHNRAERNGFKVLEDPETGIARLVVSDSKKQTIQKEKGKQPITLTTARYDGVMRVEDGNLLRKALTNGIGHAKGFGCGLLTLVPIQ